MNGRSMSEDGYRFGFNGKENDRDFGNDQLIQDYGFRVYNPALGKFLSVDPLAPDFPELTTYQFASNMPIWGIDMDGLEVIPYNFVFTENTVGQKTSIAFDIKIKMTVVDLTNQGMNGAEEASLLNSGTHARQIKKVLQQGAVNQGIATFSYGIKEDGTDERFVTASKFRLDVGEARFSSIDFTKKLSSSLDDDTFVVMIVDDLGQGQYSSNDPSPTDRAGVASLTENVMIVEKSYLTKLYTERTPDNTVTHEFMHTQGVEHPGETLEENRQIAMLMGYKGNSFVTSNEERAKVLMTILQREATFLRETARYDKNLTDEKPNRTRRNSYEAAKAFLLQIIEKPTMKNYDKSKVE